MFRLKKPGHSAARAIPLHTFNLNNKSNWLDGFVTLQVLRNPCLLQYPSS